MFNIVVGTRRSGTSLLMLAIRMAGIPILGFKYTHTIETEDGEVKLSCFPSKKLRQANPNGYWELGLITTKFGIQNEHRDIGMANDVLKLTTESYYKSDVDMIDKTILILRNPRNVLTSMQKVTIFKPEELVLSINKILKDLKETINFIKENNKKHIVITYESLLKNPHKAMQKVCEFLGRGDYIKGAEIVNNDLNRSKPFIGNYESLTKLEELYKQYAKM